jgi:hypothetical protein
VRRGLSQAQRALALALARAVPSAAGTGAGAGVTSAAGWLARESRARGKGGP